MQPRLSLKGLRRSHSGRSWKKLVSKISIGLIIVLLVISTIFVLGRTEQVTTAAENSPNPAPQFAETDSSITVRARVVPVHHAALNFPLRGIFSENVVEEVLVKEGDQVKPGDPLIRVDTRDLELRVQEAEARLAQAQANYEVLSSEAGVNRLRSEADLAYLIAEAGMAKLRAEAEAAKLRGEAQNARFQGLTQLANLLDANANDLLGAAEVLGNTAQVNQERLLAALEMMDVANTATITSALAQLQQADVALQRERLLLEQATLRSPIGGTVVEVNATIGTMPNATGPAVVVADLSSWQLETIDLTELSVARIKEGDPVTVTFDALPGVQLPGRVIHIQPIGETDITDNTSIYSVIIGLEQQSELLRWNMTAWVTFASSSSSGSK